MSSVSVQLGSAPSQIQCRLHRAKTFGRPCRSLQQKHDWQVRQIIALQAATNASAITASIVEDPKFSQEWQKVLADLKLNAEQTKAACAAHDLPLLLRAGAGSGKTTTIIARILYFTIGLGIPGTRTLAITFTNKAADEMRARLERKGVQGVKVQTFHSFGLKLVKAFYREANFGPGGPHILTSDAEQRALLAEAMRWASMTCAQEQIVKWLGLPSSLPHNWGDIMQQAQESDPVLFSRAKEDANERVSQSLSKVEKAESEKAMEEENSGNSPVVDTDPRFDKDKKEKRIYRLSGLELYLTVYNALFKKHDPEMWAIKSAQVENKNDHPGPYDFKMPGQPPTKQQVRSMYNWIKAQKTGGKSPEDFPQDILGGRVFKEYQNLLRDNNSVDFDDILTITVKLLADKQYPYILQSVQDHNPYMLVDEYQDSNPLQVKLIELLQGVMQQITVVGDDFQSIYGFRGAVPDVFQTFIEHFKHDRLDQSLQMNYRSRPEILEAGMQVLKDNKSVLRKELRPARKSAKFRAVHVWQTENPAQEARAIMLEMKRLHEDKHVDYKQMVCLFRVMRSGRAKALDQELLREGIPHHIAKGTALMDQAVIKDILAYVRLLLNPKDDSAFERVCNKPARRLGPKFFQALKRFKDNKRIRAEPGAQGTASDFSYIQCCKDMLNEGMMSSYKKGLWSFLRILDIIKASSANQKPSEVILSVILKTGYWDSLVDEAVKADAKKRKEGLVQGQIHDMPEEDEEDENEDEEVKEEQRKRLLDFAKKRERDKQNNTTKGQQVNPQKQPDETELAASKGSQLTGPLQDLYSLFHEFEENYKFGKDDFQASPDGQSNGPTLVTRDLEAYRLTDSVEFDAALQGKGFHPLLSAMEHFDLASQQDSVKDEQGVTLCTVHAAKGLEWDYVFVPQQVERTFPLHPRVSKDCMSEEAWRIFERRHKVDFGSGIPNCFITVLRRWRPHPRPGMKMDAFEQYCMENFEEEERLLHVAITRAREAVYLLSTRFHAPSKDGRTRPATKSFFLKDIEKGGFTRIFRSSNH